MTPQVSVIIPVYNVGKYLEKCLTSVVGQTFSNLEIVVVTDGSTDDSPQIIARFARQDSRIVVIDKPNEGLAYARKSGVEAARGIYIYHLDGDDYIEPDAIELIYANALASLLTASEAFIPLPVKVFPVNPAYSNALV